MNVIVLVWGTALYHQCPQQPLLSILLTILLWAKLYRKRLHYRTGGS